MRAILFMTGFFWTAVLCGMVMAEPFAPLVDIPDDLSNSEDEEEEYKYMEDREE